MSNEQTTIEGLFGNISTHYEIPSYQRAYSWDKEQWAQFFDDLLDADAGYYLGHYLFERVGKTLLVIDGQQRLTTCVIFVRAVCDVLAGNERYEKDLRIWQRCYLEDPDQGPRLQTVAYDNPLFQDCIVAGKNPPASFRTLSSMRIAEAKEYFARRLSVYEGARVAELMRRLAEAVITVYPVSDRTMAAQIFSYQNDRGRELTKLEVIKAQLMLTVYKKGGSESSKKIIISSLDQRFAEIYETITRARLDEDRVLANYWKARNDYGAGDVVEEVKAELAESENPVEWATEFVAQLSVAFSFVEKFLADGGEYPVRLRQMNNLALAYPFMIKAYISGVKMESKAFGRLLRLLENLTFRSLIRGGRADIQTRLNGHLRQITDEASLITEIGAIITAIKEGWWYGYWSDAEMARCLDGWFYGNRVDNYLLWQFELSLYDHGYNGPVAVTASEMLKQESIEHIAPQTNPGEELANGYGCYVDKENEERGIESGGWMNTLGNLLLASQSQNSYLGNHSFEFKLKDYSKNVLKQQTGIAQYAEKDEKGRPEWTVESIRKRHEDIVAWAMDNWSLDRI